MSKYTIMIEETLPIEYRDAGPWRSYEFSAWGFTREELIENATIAEVDQDGGEICCYGLDRAPNNEVEHYALAMIDAAVKSEREIA